MAASIDDKDEPMDVDQDEDVVLLTLSLEWLESDKQQKKKTNLQKCLQTWFNKKDMKVDCTVEKALNRIAVIKIKPPPALNNLQKLKDETLTSKDGTKIATVKSVILGVDTPTPDDASVTPSSVTENPADKQKSEEQSDSSSAAGNTPADVTTSSDESLVPVTTFMYVSHMYKEELRRIEQQYKVKLKSNFTVKFETDQDDGKPEEATSKFINLVQNRLSETQGSTVPLKSVDPDQWRDAMKVIKNKDNGLLVTMTSEELVVWGPDQGKNALSAILTATPSSAFQSSTPLKIDMTITDPLVEGLTMDDKSWKLMTTSLAKQVVEVEQKFNVDLKVSDISQGKVNVRPSYKRPGENTAMESHAVRALLRLYQKVVTLPERINQLYGATGLSNSKNTRHDSQSNGPALNGNSSERNSEAPPGGATAGDSEDDTCPICLDSFKKKKRLKCKHEFCEECLQKSKKHSGPICPLCKKVFGRMEGNQPDGTMTWHKSAFPLPGFPDCGQILITYCIPGGIQTEKHPNPGQRFQSTNRMAYLPDNKEGNEVLKLLKKAFDQKLIFTVGASRTTGMDNQVTWNDIHHKTSPMGGPASFGYPDPDYLSRVKDELKAKGIE